MALDVHLVTPEREVWAGSAEMVIARGTDGMVGILSGHAPLLIRLSIAPIRIQLEDGRWIVAVVDGGFLHVTSAEDSTRVDVLASFAELSDDIDRVAAQARVEQAQARLAQGDDASARAELGRYRGREIDTAGDGFLATFDGPARAVRCARAIADSVRDLGIQIRAGVHTGEVEVDGDAVRGIAVHIGARVAALADHADMTLLPVQLFCQSEGLRYPPEVAAVGKVLHNFAADLQGGRRPDRTVGRWWRRW